MLTNYKKIIIGFAVAMLASTTVHAAKIVTVATGAQGSLAYNSGQAIAKVANQKAHIRARTQPLVGYLPLINSGEVEFGFSNGVEAEFALKGTGNYDRPNPNLRVVGTMFPLKTGLMVVADTGIKTVADLKKRAGKLRIASEYKSSTIIPFYISGALANGGMKYEDFKMVPVSNFVKGIDALGSGLVDVSLVSLNSGAGKKAEAQMRSRGGLQYVSLDMSPDAVAAFKKYLPAGNIVSLKANDSIPGLKAPANIIEIPWMMLTNKDAPDDLVYKMTKMVAEHNKELGESFGAFKRAQLKQMAPAVGVPYHPGALKYYREAGIPVGK